MSKLPNFASVHVHTQSLDTGSLWDSWVKREKELETGALVSTDHGSLGGCRTGYRLAKKNGLIYIPGIEGYLRPSKCEILEKHGIQKDDDGTYKSYIKYLHFTMHHLDEDAYLAQSKILSKRFEDSAEKHGKELKPIYTWEDLEELSNYNITIASGCLIGMVMRFIHQHNNFEIAEDYYQKLRALKPGNFFVELAPHVCDRNWDSAVYATLKDGSEIKFKAHKNLKLSTFEKGFQAKELARKKMPEGTSLTAIMENRKWVEREPVEVVKMELREGYTINDCMPWAPDGDIMTGCNKFLFHLANKYGDPVVIGDDAHQAYPEEKVVQDVKLMSGGDNWRFTTNNYRYSSDDAFKHFKERMDIDESTFRGWVDNSLQWRDRFKDFKFNDRLHLPAKFYPENTLEYVKKIIDDVGRMNWSNEKYKKRLQDEIKIIHSNGKADFLPYFFTIKDALKQYEDAGELTSPGRGSVGSLLLAYVMRITHVDPVEYDLPKERFMTPERFLSGKLPDIDLDLPGKELLTDPETGWLAKRFGDHQCQISTITTLKLRNSVLDLSRVRYKEVPENIRFLTSNFKNAPQGLSDTQFVLGYKDDAGDYVEGSITYDTALQQYIAEYPNDWEDVKKCLGISRQLGRHPSGWLVADVPISDFIPTTKVSDVTVTQYTANDVEAAGGVKFDFLGLNSLKDISRCLKIIRGRQSIPAENIKINNELVHWTYVVPFAGQLYDIWKLPEDQKVFKEICLGNNSTVFQLDGGSAAQWIKKFNVVIGNENGEEKRLIHSLLTLAHFTALDRKGPLDAVVPGTSHNVLVEYVERAQGRINGTRIPLLEELLPETKGLVIYQEQLTKVFQVLGETTASQAEEFRAHTSKKLKDEIVKDRAAFMPKATEKLGLELATQVWETLNTFAEYGFNKAHALEYSKVIYATAWLKYHYPLEWWCALLQNADKTEIETKFWKHCGHMVLPPDINNSGDSFAIVGDKIVAPISSLQGIGAKAHAQLCKYRPYKDIQDFCNKLEEYKIENAKSTVEGVVRKGTSAINSSHIASMIIVGVMDSLFPPNLCVEEKMDAFTQGMAIATNSKVKPLKEKYNQNDSLAIFMHKRKVLQSYTEDMCSLMTNAKLPNLYTINGVPRYIYKENKIPFLNAKKLEILEDPNTPFPGKHQIALPAYIIEEALKTYQGNKQRQVFLLDIEGMRREIVRWPDYGTGKLPKDAAQDIEGNLVIVTLEKYRADKPYSIKHIEVVAKAI